MFFIHCRKALTDSFINYNTSYSLLQLVVLKRLFSDGGNILEPKRPTPPPPQLWEALLGDTSIWRLTRKTRIGKRKTSNRWMSWTINSDSVSGANLAKFYAGEDYGSRTIDIDMDIFSVNIDNFDFSYTTSTFNKSYFFIA